ncbi:hypothetical protein BV22DRAFT_61947 [Leucogyrophana mollusca]|uniref:Uncharacterized protein n=1 Tax=Leucogyrophana mollusca TaxID=85980 RepID=A0ACB8BXL2_9AGAM|nr:hypothetical protein BV22DRAFT_61947 [Leucogyrophana mollusca]
MKAVITWCSTLVCHPEHDRTRTATSFVRHRNGCIRQFSPNNVFQLWYTLWLACMNGIQHLRHTHTTPLQHLALPSRLKSAMPGPMYIDSRFETHDAPRHHQTISHRRTRTSSVSAISPSRARKYARDAEQARYNAPLQHAFSPEYSMTWRDLGPRDEWAVAQREQERVIQEEAERALYYHRRAGERKSREQRASIDRSYSRGTMPSLTRRGSVSSPDSHGPRTPTHSTRYRSSRPSEYPSGQRDHSHKNRVPAYTFPGHSSAQVFPHPPPEGRCSLDAARVAVCTVVTPAARPRKTSILARLNPFGRSRTTSMSEIHHHYHGVVADSLQPGRSRRMSTTPSRR